MDLEKFSDNGVLTEDLAKNHKSEVEKKLKKLKIAIMIHIVIYRHN